MVLTNALLTICFSLVSNFVQTTSLPEGSSPTQLQDIERYNLGFRFSPTDTYLRLKNGNEFWIQSGVVQRFLAPTSLFLNDDRFPLVRGVNSVLSSNEVVALATRLVRELIKREGARLSDLSSVQVHKARDGTEGAFYTLLWQPSDPTNVFPYSAAVEIDARRQQMTFMDLRDRRFFDPAYALQISNRVILPDRQTNTASPLQFERPNAEQLSRAVAGWQQFRNRFRLPFGTQDNLGTVDQERSYIHTNAAAKPSCKVRFLTGVSFEYCDGIVVMAAASDASFVGRWGNEPRSYWQRFHGKVLHRWQDLADDFKSVLKQSVGLPAAIVDSLDPDPAVLPSELGNAGLKRTLLAFNSRRDAISSQAEEALIVAEFDLETGELKQVTLRSERLNELLRDAFANGRK